MALHFSLRSPLVDSTVVGVKTTSRLAALDQLAAVEVPGEIWPELDALQQGWGA